MGLKYKRNTSGWTPTKEDNLINNDDPWTADFRVRKESKKKKRRDSLQDKHSRIVSYANDR